MAFDEATAVLQKNSAANALNKINLRIVEKEDILAVSGERGVEFEKQKRPDTHSSSVNPNKSITRARTQEHPGVKLRDLKTIKEQDLEHVAAITALIRSMQNNTAVSQQTGSLLRQTRLQIDPIGGDLADSTNKKNLNGRRSPIR